MDNWEEISDDQGLFLYNVCGRRALVAFAKHCFEHAGRVPRGAHCGLSFVAGGQELFKVLDPVAGVLFGKYLDAAHGFAPEAEARVDLQGLFDEFGAPRIGRALRLVRWVVGGMGAEIAVSAEELVGALIVLNYALADEEITAALCRGVSAGDQSGYGPRLSEMLVALYEKNPEYARRGLGVVFGLAGAGAGAGAGAEELSFLPEACSVQGFQLRRAAGLEAEVPASLDPNYLLPVVQSLEAAELDAYVTKYYSKEWNKNIKNVMALCRLLVAHAAGRAEPPRPCPFEDLPLELIQDSRTKEFWTWFTLPAQAVWKTAYGNWENESHRYGRGRRSALSLPLAVVRAAAHGEPAEPSKELSEFVAGMLLDMYCDEAFSVEFEKLRHGKEADEPRHSFDEVAELIEQFTGPSVLTLSRFFEPGEETAAAGGFRSALSGLSERDRKGRPAYFYLIRDFHRRGAGVLDCLLRATRNRELVPLCSVAAVAETFAGCEGAEQLVRFKIDSLFDWSSELAKIAAKKKWAGPLPSAASRLACRAWAGRCLREGARYHLRDPDASFAAVLTLCGDDCEFAKELFGPQMVGSLRLMGPAASRLLAEGAPGNAPHYSELEPALAAADEGRLRDSWILVKELFADCIEAPAGYGLDVLRRVELGPQARRQLEARGVPGGPPRSPLASADLCGYVVVRYWRARSEGEGAQNRRRTRDVWLSSLNNLDSTILRRMMSYRDSPCYMRNIWFCYY